MQAAKSQTTIIDRKIKKDMNVLKNKHNAVALLVTGLLALALSGCQKEGPAEKAGKEIDKTMSQAGQEIQKMGEGIQNAARDIQK